MYPLNGLEQVALDRVEEMRVRAERERLVRSLPRSEGWMRMAVRSQWSRLRMAVTHRPARMEQIGADIEAFVSQRPQSESAYCPVVQERRLLKP